MLNAGERRGRSLGYDMYTLKSSSNWKASENRAGPEKSLTFVLYLKMYWVQSRSGVNSICTRHCLVSVLKQGGNCSLDQPRTMASLR